MRRIPGACSTLTALLRKRMRTHLRRSRPERNPQRIPANTPPVFPSLAPLIWPHLRCLVTKAMSDRLLGFVAISLLVWLGGCAATQEAKSVEKSGFLGDYSRLKPGQRGSFFSQGAEDQALLVYQNPDVDWRKYKKVWVDPVTIWMKREDSQLWDVSGIDRQRLAALLWSKLDESLKKDYETTSQPGPDVLHIQVAITEAGPSQVVDDMVTSAALPAKLLLSPKSFTSGVAAFAGSASAEMRVIDSATGTILLEAVDRRGGTKSVGGSWSSWHDVEEAYRFWAEKIRYRLCQFRGGLDCVEPKA
jgi:hypothetical protein